MLSEKAKKSYIKNGGTKCPHCGSANIEGEAVDIESGHAYQEVGCIDCDQEWVDVYTLTGIQE